MLKSSFLFWASDKNEIGRNNTDTNKTLSRGSYSLFRKTFVGDLFYMTLLKNNENEQNAEILFQNTLGNCQPHYQTIEIWLWYFPRS